MGRRAATYGSPIDTAMERYHNDIGSRLSGVFAPTHPVTETLSGDMCMLTLDTRRSNSLNRAGKSTPLSSKNSNSLKSNMSLTGSSSSVVSSSSRTDSERENIPKDKKRLVDKLTHALFQKKHTCARCKRKSRSCMPNKTFTNNEKHYMCEQCRQQSHAVKNLFTQSNSRASEISNSTSSKSASSGTTEQGRVTPQPRTENIDSGYDTAATSCSTLSSDFSTFSAPAVYSKEIKPGCEDYCSVRHNPSPIVESHSELQTQSSLAPITNYKQDNEPDFYEFVCVSNGVSPNLRQVKHKNTHHYDGYLPDIDYMRFEKFEIRSPLADVTNFEGHTVDGKQCTLENARDGFEQKCCALCSNTSKPCFRLPQRRGWICEDCLDDIF